MNKLISWLSYRPIPVSMLAISIILVLGALETNIYRADGSTELACLYIFGQCVTGFGLLVVLLETERREKRDSGNPPL